jgi:hypothetical protein
MKIRSAARQDNSIDLMDDNRIADRLIAAIAARLTPHMPDGFTVAGSHGVDEVRHNGSVIAGTSVAFMMEVKKRFLGAGREITHSREWATHSINPLSDIPSERLLGAHRHKSSDQRGHQACERLEERYGEDRVDRM